MSSLDAHLDIIREVLTERSPLSFSELASQVEELAVKRHVATSRPIIARVLIAAIANLDAVREAFPEVPPILMLLADGRYLLKS